MLGRRDKTQVPAEPAEAEQKPPGGGKGRPTPKRSEAERQRRTRVQPPANRKEARQRLREESRAERELRRRGMASGDARYLPRRDQGPVRAYVRDVVDARRSIAEYFLVIMLAILVVSLLGSAFHSVRIANSVLLLWPLMLVLIIIDAVRLGVRLRSSLQQRFPDENRRGALAYGIMRSTQLRSMRLPKPRVARGADVKR